MNDLISRQAVIDEAEEWIDAAYCEDGDQRERDAIRHVINGIKKLPAVQTCEDAVSRAAAINALMKRDKELRNINWYDKPFAEGECKGIDYALEIVNALPSVQPTQSNAYNALKTLDCIDRQAAIDKLDPLFESLAIDKIKALPTAQPQTEIIYCKDCKHRDPEDKKCDCGHDILWQLPRDDNWFCADAERRTDGSDSVQPEHTMEEFMYGQDMGNPEDGSL